MPGRAATRRRRSYPALAGACRPRLAAPSGRCRSGRSSIQSSLAIEGRSGAGERAKQLDLALAHAVHEIAQLAAFLFLDETVDVGLEAGELLVEAPCELQELHDPAVEPLARDRKS